MINHIFVGVCLFERLVSHGSEFKRQPRVEVREIGDLAAWYLPPESSREHGSYPFIFIQRHRSSMKEVLLSMQTYFVRFLVHLKEQCGME